VANCTASSLISDNLAVDAWKRAHRKIWAGKTVSFRAISRIYTDLFAVDNLKLALILNLALTADGLLKQFNTEMFSLLNKHAPLRQIDLTVRPDCFRTYRKSENENFCSCQEGGSSRRKSMEKLAFGYSKMGCIFF
jgi:hypothetical protein